MTGDVFRIVGTKSGKEYASMGFPEVQDDFVNARCVNKIFDIVMEEIDSDGAVDSEGLKVEILGGRIDPDNPNRLS